MSFNFLKNLKLKEIEGTKKVVDSKHPVGLSLRVFTNNSVFPSPDLVERLNLEYQLAEDGTLTGNGLDFFLSSEWPIFPTELPKVVFVAPIKRGEAKIDLFSTRRSETTSVLTQGNIAEDFVQMLKMALGENIFGDKNYVDVYVRLEEGFTTENKIYYLPKKVTRGERAGETTYIRRENTTLYPLSLEPAANSPAEITSDNIAQESPLEGIIN